MTKPIKRKRTKTIEKLKKLRLRYEVAQLDKYLEDHYDAFLKLVNSNNGYEIVNMQESNATEGDENL